MVITVYKAPNIRYQEKHACMASIVERYVRASENIMESETPR